MRTEISCRTKGKLLYATATDTIGVVYASFHTFVHFSSEEGIRISLEYVESTRLFHLVYPTADSLLERS